MCTPASFFISPAPLESRLGPTLLQCTGMVDRSGTCSRKPAIPLLCTVVDPYETGTQDKLPVCARRPRPLRAGDEGRAGAPYGRRIPYCRADGNLRLWSGADTPGSNERVRRSPRPSLGWPVWSAVFGPGIPCLEAWGAVKVVKVSAGQTLHIPHHAPCR